MLSFTHLLELAAIVVAGTMVGNELAVAIFFHPRISALDDATHVRAARTLAAALGRAMPFWYALTLLLSGTVAFYARPAGTPGHGLAMSAAGLFAAMIVYSVLLPVPINNQVARWQPESLPANWRALRRRWDALHAVRVGVLLLALVLLVTSCLVSPAA
jgi:Anthrone oxygenase